VNASRNFMHKVSSISSYCYWYPQKWLYLNQHTFRVLQGRNEMLFIFILIMPGLRCFFLPNMPLKWEFWKLIYRLSSLGTCWNLAFWITKWYEISFKNQGWAPKLGSKGSFFSIFDRVRWCLRAPRKRFPYEWALKSLFLGCPNAGHKESDSLFLSRSWVHCNSFFNSKSPEESGASSSLYGWRLTLARSMPAAFAKRTIVM